MAQMPAVSNSSTVRRTFSPLPQPWSASTSSAKLPARQIRLACPANSVKVRTTRWGAPSTDIDPIEPENMPTSKPRSSAMRAEIASYTDPGWTQRFPERIARKRSRRSVQFMVSPYEGFRDGFSRVELIMRSGRSKGGDRGQAHAGRACAKRLDLCWDGEVY